MKAWRVTDKYCCCGTVIVFAETKGQAASWALSHDDTFDDCDFVDLCVRRFKDYDKFYSGKRIVDFWNDHEDKIRLVRDFGWSCQEADFYCEECPASKWCEKYKEMYDDE